MLPFFFLSSNNNKASTYDLFFNADKTIPFYLKTEIQFSPSKYFFRFLFTNMRAFFRTVMKNTTTSYSIQTCHPPKKAER